MIDALPLLLGPEGYQINRSLRFRSSASAYLSRTFSSGTRTTWTWSSWVKRGAVGVVYPASNYAQALFGLNDSDKIYFYEDSLWLYLGTGATYTAQPVDKFRDPSAWYHIVVVLDTTNATSADRIRLYVNNRRITVSGTMPTQNWASSNFNSAINHNIGKGDNANGYFFDGYLTEINFIDGQALDPSSFGETNAVTGVWQPKKYAGTYGTNGFYLPFSTSASQSVTADYLVVAGGGGGGIAGGGAGAGGLLTGSTSLSTGTSYAVTVGAGGIGTNNYTSTSGGNSVFSSFTAIGGAVGSQSTEAGKNGGSGSGGGAGAPGFPGGLGTVGQGNNGGSSFGSPNFGVGGGGGAGAVGANGTSSTSGAGGAGIVSSISGSPVTYAGGGGGGGINGTSNGAGGAGGGGTGGVSGGANATSGTPNTGGGGGGGANGGGTTGGNGGSGVVIVSYAGAARFSGGTITSSGGNTIHTFTSSGALTSLFNDYSPNGNNWTGNNFDVGNTAAVTYDSMLDVPTLWADGGNGRGNYCTGNPLIMYNGGGGAPIVPKNGNLDLIGGAGWAMVGSTIAVSTGKWYWEATFFKPGSGDGMLGIHKSNTTLFQIVGYSGDPNGYGYSAGGSKFNNNTGAAYGASYTNGDVIGVALDLDAGTLTFYKNNTSQGVAFSSLSGEFFPAFSSETAYFQANFGQRPFAYTPPTGFKALNTQNLPTPTILKGNQYFDAITYSGNSTYPRTIGGLNFQPDLVWQKARSITYDHILYDAVRGTGTSKSLSTNRTSAEGFNSTFANLTAFAADGFTVDTTSSTNILNNSGQTYVAWQWKEGATQGFDIVTYTGTGVARTISHSLGVAPRMIIIFERSPGGDDHIVYHSNLTSNQYSIRLNTTAAQAGPSANYWNSTSPTSTDFSVGTSGENNQNTATYVAYLFSEVAGYSKFGSYTGNGSANGPMIFTGFRPRYVLFKRTDSATGGEWSIYDSSRNTYNACNTELYPANSSGDETAGGASMDLLSNGFKIRNSRLGINASGGTYIYAAFAENPFKNALAR